VWWTEVAKRSPSWRSATSSSPAIRFSSSSRAARPPCCNGAPPSRGSTHRTPRPSVRARPGQTSTSPASRRVDRRPVDVPLGEAPGRSSGSRSRKLVSREPISSADPSHAEHPPERPPDGEQPAHQQRQPLCVEHAEQRDGAGEVIPSPGVGSGHTSSTWKSGAMSWIRHAGEVCVSRGSPAFALRPIAACVLTDEDTAHSEDPTPRRMGAAGIVVSPPRCTRVDGSHCQDHRRQYSPMPADRRQGARTTGVAKRFNPPTRTPAKAQGAHPASAGGQPTRMTAFA
jgi:hypothetical protein